MSDTESVFEEDSIDRELIAVVRVNRFLHDKTEKLYANVEVKTNAWAQIGASLINPLEGSVAEKRFYALRQRFGKERRKVTQSMPRSGAGTDQPTYTPTWILYKDLRFLKDIIKPRKTSSNDKSKAPANPSSQVPVFRTSSPSLSTSAFGGEVTVLHTISPISSTSAVVSPSPDMSSCSNDFFISLAGTDESSTYMSETLFSPPPIIPSPTTPTPPPAIASGSGSNDTVAQVQRAMSNISNKRKAPPTDNFAFRKRQEADTVNKILIEQGKGLTNLAAKIGEAIMASPPPPKSPLVVVSNTSPGTQPMLSAIGFALSTVPEHTQLKCLIGILQYINDFSNNKSGQAQ